MAPPKVEVAEEDGATPIPTTEKDDAPPPATSTVTDEQWTMMQTILNNIYNYRTEDGSDPSKVFHRKINKRVIPEYYDIIKEPIALSTVKAKLHSREYKSFEEYVRDFALIPHNAFVFNLPNAEAYQDAVLIKAKLEEELAEAVKNRVISEETSVLPDLGEIPPADEQPAEGEEEQEDEDEEAEDEDEDEDEDDEGATKKRRGRGRPFGSTKREGAAKKDEDDKEDTDVRKRRGRPPRVDTPMEARIKNILKGLRKNRGADNQLKIVPFERLPDKAAMPEYYAEIKTPMAIDVMKKKLKRKKYNTLEQFMKDMELMFENAKLYNTDESQVYKDAVELQQEARSIAEAERQKPDSDFAMEEGRIPLPNGILHNGELWKVGDWVHIQNPNDLTKPVVAQIYRTWQDGDGQKWINACWYYRPEQTVHRFDKHFFEHEVVKTGQYRDHHIDEIVDRCFVMFFTRFNKGRPRGFPANKEVYVCEARYNEEKHKINKIKTWASCLPDEVREKDYEMDLFEAPRRMKKLPSPIAYLLKDDQKETDDLPKPEWGAENAPPKIGAVHRRPRDPKESPPPEPTPSPPPAPQPQAAPPPPPAHPQTSPASETAPAAQPSHQMAGQQPQHQHQQRSTYTPTQQQQYQNAAPSPGSNANRMITPQPAYAPHTPSAAGHNTAQQQYTTPHTAVHPQFAQTAQVTEAPERRHANQYTARAPVAYGQPTAVQNYKAPTPVEVYTLPEVADRSIPLHIRNQFQCDEYGRVLFFTTPPLNAKPTEKEGAAVGRSVEWVAGRLERAEERKEARKRQREERDAAEAVARKKRIVEERDLRRDRDAILEKASSVLSQQLSQSVRQQFRGEMGEGWNDVLTKEIDRLEALQNVSDEMRLREDEKERKRQEKRIVPLIGDGLL